MSDQEFYCNGCHKHKPLRLQSDYQSPSGKATCTTCDTRIQKGVSTGKSSKKFNTRQVKNLANHAHIINMQTPYTE